VIRANTSLASSVSRRLRPVDGSRKFRPSVWMWVPYVWLFFSSTRSLSTWLSGQSGTGNDLTGNPVDRLLMVLLMALGLYVLLGARAKQTGRILAQNKWVVALFLYMALSILWSNFPGITMRRCARSMGTFIMVLVVLTESSPLEAIRILLRRLYLLQIPLSVVAIKFFRNIGVVYNWSGVEEEWVGLSTDKNSLGQVAMCSGLFALWELLKDYPRRKAKPIRKKLLVDGLLLCLTLWLLRGSKNVHSSTAIVGFVVCAFILVLLQFVKKRSRRARQILFGTMACLLLAAPIAYLGFEAFDTTPVKLVVQATGRDMTLTDRTLLWTDIWNNAMKTPVLGVGMGAFWVGPPGYDMYPLPNWSLKTPEWRPEEGHNGYLDIYVELGIGGVLLILGIIVKAFAGALNHLQTDFQYGSLRLVLLLSIVLNNFTETSFLKGTHDFWFLFLLLAVNPPGVSAQPATRRPPTRSREERGQKEKEIRIEPVAAGTPLFRVGRLLRCTD
jgi:exopolysaccharide production protein ExoQ